MTILNGLAPAFADQNNWTALGVVTSASRAEPGPYAGLDYSVAVNVPTRGVMKYSNAVPAPGLRRMLNDAIVDIVPCAVGTSFMAVCVGGHAYFLIPESPLMGEC